MGQLLSILGAVLILEGIPYFAFPKKAKDWATSIQSVPESTLRIMGLVAMASGLVLLYANRFF